MTAPGKKDEQDREELMRFLLETPFDEEVIAMDCADGCEELSQLAERVAAGESVATLMPALKEHMHYWKDCREEFEALVALVKAENAGLLPDLLALDSDETPEDDAHNAEPGSDAP